MWEAVYIIEGLLKNTSEVKPTTVHADTQDQSQPVFALAHLLGFELMPRIRNWKGLTFYRPSKQTECVHIDSLFGNRPAGHSPAVLWKFYAKILRGQQQTSNRMIDAALADDNGG